MMRFPTCCFGDDTVLCHADSITPIKVETGGFCFASQVAVATFGLATASRCPLLQTHRSGVRILPGFTYIVLNIPNGIFKTMCGDGRIRTSGGSLIPHLFSKEAH